MTRTMQDGEPRTRHYRSKDGDKDPIQGPSGWRQGLQGRTDDDLTLPKKEGDKDPITRGPNGGQGQGPAEGRQGPSCKV